MRKIKKNNKTNNNNTTTDDLNMHANMSEMCDTSNVSRGEIHGMLLIVSVKCLKKHIMF